MDDVENIERFPDRVAQSFENQTILITGVTGFVGKVLLEKLLRTSPQIRKIFVLIRPKYNLTSNERLEKIFQSALFDLLKANVASQEAQEAQEAQVAPALVKVFAVQGDVALLDLGLSAADRTRLIAEVNIVYHCAALLRLDESLKIAVLLNVRGTKLLLDLAKQMQHLRLFCHISSAYCHLHERILYERPYAPPADPLRIIAMCERADDNVLSAFTHKILDNHPNTYCFTKALAEGVVNRALTDMPVILLRPSLVIPALKEPIPGWTDTINGSLGFQIAAGKGILRTLYLDVTCYADLIPVDIAVNAILAASYDYRTRSGSAATPQNACIFNLTTSHEHKVTWHDIIRIGREVIYNSIPLNWVLWYPGGSIKPTRFLHDCAFYVQHVLPSLLVDGLLWLVNRPPVLLPIYRRIQKGFEILKFYNGKQWDFDNTEAMAVIKRLNPHERRKYNLQNPEFDYREYFSDCTLCARRYILHEADDTLPRARKHMQLMYYLDKLVVTLCVMWLVTVLCKYWSA